MCEDCNLNITLLDSQFFSNLHRRTRLFRRAIESIRRPSPFLLGVCKTRLLASSFREIADAYVPRTLEQLLSEVICIRAAESLVIAGLLAHLEARAASENLLPETLVRSRTHHFYWLLERKQIWGVRRGRKPIFSAVFLGRFSADRAFVPINRLWHAP